MTSSALVISWLWSWEHWSWDVSTLKGVHLMKDKQSQRSRAIMTKPTWFKLHRILLFSYFKSLRGHIALKASLHPHQQFRTLMTHRIWGFLQLQLQQYALRQTAKRRTVIIGHQLFRTSMTHHIWEFPQLPSTSCSFQRIVSQRSHQWNYKKQWIRPAIGGSQSACVDHLS